VGTWALGGAFADWDLRVNFGLDYFAVDAHRDRTAVDAESGGAQLSAKLGDSVARWNGRSGTILEQYYGAPPGQVPFSGHWGLTPAELRRSTIRNHLLGMRQLVFHGFYQTDGADRPAQVLANPRFDFPPGINYEPWFDRYHRAFAHETGRLSAFLDAARPACPVAVLYPLATLLADGLESEAGRHTGQWCERLSAPGSATTWCRKKPCPPSRAATAPWCCRPHGISASRPPPRRSPHSPAPADSSTRRVAARRSRRRASPAPRQYPTGAGWPTGPRV
jgi:hypothetical protein